MGQEEFEFLGPGQVLGRGDRPHPRLACHRCVAIILLCVAVATTGFNLLLFYLFLGLNASEMIAEDDLALEYGV